MNARHTFLDTAREIVTPAWTPPHVGPADHALYAKMRAETLARLEAGEFDDDGDDESFGAPVNIRIARSYGVKLAGDE